MRETEATKMACSAFPGKINVYNEERSQGHFCHLKKLLGVPSNTQRKNNI